MLGAYLKKKFGKDKDIPVAEQFFSPLRIALHSTIDIATVDWLMLGDTLHNAMKLPAGRLTVLAIGKTIADRDEIYNIYMEDTANEEFILQLYCTVKDGKGTLAEATLYKQVVNIVPLSESAWDANTEGFGMPTLDLDNDTYKRVWSPDSNSKIGMMDFDETVVESDRITEYKNSFMLYSRSVATATGATENEMLLVGIEETTETAEITMMLGLNVPLQNIKVQ